MSDIWVMVNGEKQPYDRVVKIYVDCSTGDWVVDAPFKPEVMAQLFSDAAELFLDKATEPDETPIHVMHSNDFTEN